MAVRSSTPVTVTASMLYHEDSSMDLTLQPFLLDRVRLTGVLGDEVEAGKSFTATVYLNARR